MQTEFHFTLPHGLVDSFGQVHRHGRMRLAHAMDEIESGNDPRVLNNPLYLPILLLSRVVVQIGTLPMIPAETIQTLFAADLAYLENFYQQINRIEPLTVETNCPYCQQAYALEIEMTGSVT